MEGDVLRGVPCGAGDDHGRGDALGKGRRPAQRLHAAHRAADHGEQLSHAEMIEQHRLRTNHVADGDDREAHSPGVARGGIDRRRPRAAQAAAQHVRADDEIAIGVDRLARPHHPRPPAGLAGARMGGGDMLIAGQGMAHQDRVAAIGREGAICLVADVERRQQPAAVEAQRPRQRHRTASAITRIVGHSAVVRRLCVPVQAALASIRLPRTAAAAIRPVCAAPFI